MNEIWKDIPNYEGIYQASNLGRIRSPEGKKTVTQRHGVRVWKERIIKPKGCKDYSKIGYRVTLWKNGKGKDFLVARLVCTTFFENLIDTKMTVNHKDGNRLNNNIKNLEWLTLGDNIRHGINTGLYSNMQKKIVICDSNNNRLSFDSLCECSRFLQRSKGYVSGRIGKGCTVVISKENETFTILEK